MMLRIGSSRAVRRPAMAPLRRLGLGAAVLAASVLLPARPTFAQG